MVQVPVIPSPAATAVEPGSALWAPSVAGGIGRRGRRGRRRGRLRRRLAEGHRGRAGRAEEQVPEARAGEAEDDDGDHGEEGAAAGGGTLGRHAAAPGAGCERAVRPCGPAAIHLTVRG